MFTQELWCCVDQLNPPSEADDQNCPKTHFDFMTKINLRRLDSAEIQ